MHQSNFYIRPAVGLTLRDPATGEPLPPEGGLMPRSAFWLRREKDGDVVQAAPAVAPAPDLDAPATPKKGGAK